MLWIALAPAAIATNHSITGAFGFLLGTRFEQVASCEKDTHSDKTQMFVCAGDKFFDRTFVHTRHGVIEMLSASRAYKDQNAEAAAKSCLADLGPLKDAIEQKHPTLLPVATNKSASFKFTEEFYRNIMPIGRSIEGYCEPMTLKVPGNDKYEVLWLNYTLSDDEVEHLIRLDDASKLKAKGLNPDIL